MCGICGIVLADTSRRVDPVLIRSMCATIAHRGPDDEGAYVHGAVGLGVRRLSIIDPTGGHQPIANEDRSLTVVFNGEIYNYRELAADLVGRGHALATRSDTEVIVHGYEEYGVNVLERLRGMFAFALWDARRDCLLVAVDRFGIKPLYWSYDRDQLVLGSEMSCLLASGLVPRELDTAALAEYLALGYVPAPASILKGVRKLEPGTLLTWERGSEPRVRRYWEPPRARASERIDARELRTLVLDALKDAVRAHLVSDVPLGAFLSGGIDSSVVVALMAEAQSGPVKTFSIGFDDPEHDELEKARLVASRYATDHHELVVRPDAVENVLPTLISHFGEPFADQSALPTYYVSGLAAGSVKVALSGDGGDELFVGYTTFRGVDLARMLEPIPHAIRRSAAHIAARPPRVRSGAWNDRFGRWSKRAEDSLAGPATAYRSKMAQTPLATMENLLSLGLLRDLATHDPFRRVNESLRVTNGTHDGLERFLRANLDVSLPSDMLVKVDRMSMAHSLEVRVPMLDHVLAETVLALPVRTRFPRWRLKGLLRDSVRHLLPEEIVSQRKHGFTVPISRWFRGDLTAHAREVLLDRVTADRGLFDVERTRVALAQHERGAQNLGAAIWSLLVLELWCRQTLDR
jgi:asparagine synthase (glutamine-hydrolysing)